MVASALLDFLTKFQVSTYVGVEDFADKFNFLFTVIILLICCLVVTTKQYVLKPIACYLSVDIGGTNLHEYVENYCWVQGTVPMTSGSNIPSYDAEWKEFEKKKILYYQWVPFVLALQCICFYIPRMLWQMFCYNRSGTDLQHIVTSANQAIHCSDEARTKMINYIAKSIEQILFQHREYQTGKWSRFKYRIHQRVSFVICSKRLGTWLVLSYIFFKLVYMANGILQLLFLGRFLGFHDLNIFSFGKAVVNNMMRGADWSTTLTFPRVGYCVVRMSHTGIQNTVTAQCVLPVNMLNERIFFFLYCWIMFALLLTLSSIPVWMFRILNTKRRRKFIRQLLIINKEITTDRKEMVMVSKFESHFLRHDGIFLLKIISINVGDVITGEVVRQLWHIFIGSYTNRNMNNPDSDDEANEDGTMIKLGHQISLVAEKSTPLAQTGTFF